jgi:hypothetical protein
MKHKLITFFFLIALGFSFNLITPTDSKAGAFGCQKNPDGAIIIQRIGENFFNLTSGVEDNQCSEEPDFYKVLIYKVAICREDPYTTGGLRLPNYDTCVILLDDFDRTDADATIIQPGLEATLPIPSLEIPVGTYPYAALVVNSKIKVKHTQTYTSDLDPDDHIGMRGFEAIAGTDNDDLGNGQINTVCWSLAKVTTLHNDAYNANDAYPVAHGLGTETAVIEPQASQATSTMQCGRTVGTPAFATEIIDDFREESGDPFAAHTDYGDVFEDTGVSGIELAALLLEDEATISSGLTKSKYININYKYASPIEITEQTIGLNIRIKTSSAISLDFGYDEANAAFWGSKMGANAFTTIFLTKSRRSRGSWR